MLISNNSPNRNTLLFAKTYAPFLQIVFKGLGEFRKYIYDKFKRGYIIKTGYLAKHFSI